MYYLIYSVERGVSSEESELPDGGHVACWIRVDSEGEAQNIAVAEIENCGWTIAALVDSHPVTREHYEQDQTGLEYFEQAEVDGEAYVHFVSKR